MRPLNRTVGVVTWGEAAGPELAAAIAGLSAAGATVLSAASLRDPALLDALLLAPRSARLGGGAGALIQAILAAGKPVGALGEGGLLALVAAGGARGLAVAAPVALHDRLIGAGAQPSMAAAVADRGIVTGAGTAFVVALLQEFAAEFASTGPRPAVPSLALIGARIASIPRPGLPFPGSDRVRIMPRALPVLP